MIPNFAYDKKVVQSIKALALDMIDNAKSGHPGICLGAAPILYALYQNHINYNVNETDWINRDRFVMSAGHGSALLYSTLFFCGYNYSLDDLKGYRSFGFKTNGHPELDIASGVEMTTGPLGQGFASSVGMAIAEAHLSSYFNVINHFTYVLCSDGDLMEGLSYEAASLAGNLKLNKLIVLYDSNRFSLDGSTSLSFTENVIQRFEAMKWHTQLVIDGNNINDINIAIENAKKEKDRPSIIEIRTIIGDGSVKQNTSYVHGSPLEQEDILQFKEKNLISEIPFDYSKEHFEYCKSVFIDRNNDNYSAWKQEYDKFVSISSNELKDKYNNLLKNNFNIDISSFIKDDVINSNNQLREINRRILNVVEENVSNIIVGSADLASSTKLFLEKYPVLSYKDYKGKNIFFGVREHCMAAVMNGLALSGLRPIGSTFLVFSDYMKPALRMSCLMNLPVTYLFTHDNISIGADGKTHQPIEQLAMLRSIPNLDVYRPADSKEIIGCWNNIINNKKPSALVISRSESDVLENTDYSLVSKGAYIVKKENGRLNGIIISTGTEVKSAIEVSNKLKDKGLNIRVISMPCMELFEKQDESYKNEILPIGYKTIVIEYSASLSWYNYVYNKKYLITLDDFGLCGNKEEIYKHYGFDIDSLVDKVEKLLK